MSSISASTSRRARIATALACAALAACASSPRLAPPEVRSADVRVVVFSLPLVRLAIDVGLDNPNAVDVALAALDVSLDIEGAAVARAALAAPVTLAARAPTTVHLQASGDLSAALAGVARSLERGGGPLRYEVAGVAQLADGTRFPFRKRGVLAHL
jgi:LEA14-like dessication related protein